jgi:hypothetical protein
MPHLHMASTFGCYQPQTFIESEDPDEAAAQLQSALASVSPLVPPLMEPLVVVGPFGGGKRGVLARLARMLSGKLAAAPVLTTKDRAAGDTGDGRW